jgi:hypothetical protein
LKNNYPLQIIEKEFNKFVELKSRLEANKLIDDEIKLKYLSLPYINDNSEVIANKIKKVVKEFYPKINLRIAFKAPAQIGDYFPFKDKVSDPKRQSLVVYRLKCMDCDAE